MGWYSGLTSRGQQGAPKAWPDPHWGISGKTDLFLQHMLLWDPLCITNPALGLQ